MSTPQGIGNDPNLNKQARWYLIQQKRETKWPSETKIMLSHDAVPTSATTDKIDAEEGLQAVNLVAELCHHHHDDQNHSKITSNG